MQPLLALATGEIHLWLCFFDTIRDERLLSSYRELLAPDESPREHRFHFERDRRRYLVTRAMVRMVLSRYVSIDPEAWMFSVGPYGKPKIANPDSKAQCLSFSISHTHSLIVLGTTRCRALGVDVENCSAREVSVELATHFFAAPEVAALAQVPQRQQQDRFFEYWTFKEAYIKAREMGLSLPLDKFMFHYPEHGVVDFAVAPELGDDAGRWQFWQIRPTPEYLIAVAAERISGQSSHLVVRETIPGVYERPAPVSCTRTSRS